MSLSPMMQQYHQAKEAVGDALLLFRMGDFYELFHDDARRASEILGITLTSRDKGANAVPMAGFPYHQLDQYLAKIVRAGSRAAICEQMENPKQAKGIVRRDVTRIVSPGTLTEDGLLDPRESNYLAAVASDGDLAGLAWVDVSTGRFQAATFARDRLGDQIVRIDPSECLIPDGDPPLAQSPVTLLPESCTVTTRPAWAFARQAALDTLTGLLGVKTLDGFGFDEGDPQHELALRAAGAIVDYLKETQRSSLGHIDRLAHVSGSDAMEIDAATWRSLEITQTLREGRREGSLLGVIDRTVTPSGARNLSEWLRRPLTNVARINLRLDAIAELVDSSALTDAVREKLRGLYDIQRLISRVTTGRASPRDLGCVGRTLAALPALKAKLAGRSSQRLAEIEQRIDLCPELRAKLEAALVEDCPPTARDGGFVRDGYLPQLDECRELMAGGKKWIAEYQAQQVQETGIPSMKVGFNKVFGYYLEVTHTHRDKVPENFIRKQTLKNAERYITPELKEYEEKVLSAEERAAEIEQRVFAELCESVISASRRLLATAEAVAELDALAGLAELARSRGYVRPDVVEQPVLDVEEGRHPVLDVLQPEGEFVPNGVRCAARSDDPEALLNADAKGEGGGERAEGQDAGPSLLLITGPNMAGKSTYIRQTALITLLAQVGSFVPAKRATIGVADRLFARVGASDELSRGQSTFMVEMTETARILNTATRRSLVVLDEIGRGTSTYDGLSLAWAIVECLHNDIGCRALFATHYHELTDLAGQLPGVANRSVAVHEHQGDVVFLHQIVERPADKSYGIHVARLAGVPRGVNQRAEAILAQLESQHDTARAPAGEVIAKPVEPSDVQLCLFESYEHPVVDKLRRIDVNQTTPLDALLLLREWQQSVSNGDA